MLLPSYQTFDVHGVLATSRPAIEHLANSQDIWTNILWTDEANTNLWIEFHYIWCKNTTAFQKKNSILKLKRGGSVMVRGSIGPGRISTTDETTNYARKS